MIVPGGGLSFDGTRWVSSRSNFLVHVNVLARLFRGKMLAMLMDAHGAGQLKFFNTQAGLADKGAFKRFIAPLRHIKWVVYSRRRLRDPNRCSAISPVTPIVSPSRIAASLQPTTPASRSAGRTTAPTARRAGRRCVCIRMSSSGDSCCTYCPGASIASATTGSWPANRAESIATARALLGADSPAVEPWQPDIAPDAPRCCAAHARTAAPA